MKWSGRVDAAGDHERVRLGPRALNRILRAVAARTGLGMLALMFAHSAHPAAPTLEYVHPPGIAVSSTNTVSVIGKFEPWPPQVWVNGAGVEFLAKTNKGELQVTVTADALPGVRLMRLFNAEGVSEPRPFVIGAGPETGETAGNDHYGQAQFIDTLPMTINGRLEKSGDVDSYAVALKSGQTLTARVDSHVLMSRLDAVLRLVTTNGQQLAWNHDSATIDPRLAWTATIDQTVVVQIFGFPYPATADVRLYGGDGAIYRLHLSSSDELPEPALGEVLTHEPPAVADLPFHAAGVLQSAGQTARVRVQTKQTGWIAAEVRAEAIGSPLDAWLKVEDPDGKQLQRNDDANGGRDPYLEWQSTTDGDYTIVVGSLTRQAGPEQRFELDVRQLEPDFTAVAVANSLVIKPGTTNEIKVNVTRLRSFTNELQILASGLPLGTHSEPVAVTEKGGETKLLLVAETGAAPFQGPFQLVARDTTTGCERPVPFLLTGSTTDNGVPGGYRTLLADRIESIWLTILAVEPPKAEPPATTAGR